MSTIEDMMQNGTAPINMDGSPAEAEPTSEQKLATEIQERETKQLEDFLTAKVYLQQLVTAWKEQEAIAEANRLTRDIDVNLDELRENGQLDDDETFIPVRVIDMNITRELPSAINFLKNSRRIAIFKDTNDTTFDASLLEAAFTEGMTYKRWITPFYKVLDGASTHGWCGVEVVYDEKKPLHASIEYVAFEDLIFPKDSKDIQTSSEICRRYKVTPLQLKQWVASFGFDLVQVNLIIEKLKESSEQDRTVTIYKRFRKSNGVVYSSWFSIEGNCTDWLKKPAIHYCGIDEQVQTLQMGPPDPLTGIPTPVPVTNWEPKPMTSYPIFIHYYRETEKPLLTDHLGRVFLDQDKQEAMTSITTAFVNKLNRASKVFASPAADVMNDGKPAKHLPIKLANGTILDKPMQFWSMPEPDPLVLKALEYLSTANAEEVGNTSFSVMNRQDSRKTAREITAAQQEGQLLDSVDLTLFSEFIRDVYSFVWLIIQSQALQNKIKFLSKPAQPNGSIVNVGGPFQSEIQMQNDIDTISRTFDIRAAGDVDVIMKDELISKMQQDWPVVQTTPIAMRFLADYLKLKYPQDGALYSTMLQQGDPKVQVINAQNQAIVALTQLPGVQHELTPAVKQSLAQIQQEAQAAIAPPGSPKPSPAQGKPQPQQPQPTQQQGQ